MNENPNVQEFCKNTQALRVINCTCLDIAKGNCRGRKRKVLPERNTECAVKYCRFQSRVLSLISMLEQSASSGSGSISQ